MAITPISTSTENLQQSKPVIPGSIKSASTNFETILNSVLADGTADPAGKQVSEEELFAALTKERLFAVKGEAVANAFSEKLKQRQLELQTSDGYIPVEKSTMSVLGRMVKDGVLTSSEGNEIFSQAFAGAQLDSNKAALWDGIGGGSDTTVAVDSIENALKKAKAAIDGFAAGTLTVDARTLSGNVVTNTTHPSSLSAGEVGHAVTPKGGKMDGAEGFLFKPISQNEGKLAILLPESMAHAVEKVLMRDVDGKVLEQARFTSYGETGSRAKYIFKRQGGGYPDNISIEVHGTDGRVTSYKIPDPSKRYD